uniref:DUF4369 domain-containing protein n=1 Tax=Flavobacterium sp. TaxID=239 RepID=UPI00404B70D9
MKKFLLFGFSLFTIVACNDSNSNDSNLHLTGDIEGLSQGKLYIQKIQDTALVVIDSITIKGDSKFETFLNLKESEVLYLSLDRGQSNSSDNDLAFFAEPGKIDIKTTLKAFYGNAKITGSKNNDLWNEFKQINDQFNAENLKLISLEMANKISVDSLEKNFERLKTRKYRYAANFAATHGNFEIAPYIAISEIADINVVFLDTIQKNLAPEIAKSKYGKMLKKHIKERKSLE